MDTLERSGGAVGFVRASNPQLSPGVAGAALALLALALPARGDWTQFQSDPAHSGYVREAVDVGAIRPIWSFTAPGFSAGPGDRAVAIDARHVYATVLEGYGPAGPYHVIAFDRLTGREVWRNTIRPVSHSGVSGPSLMGDTVYVHHYGHSGNTSNTNIDDYPTLVGIDANTGATRFKTMHDGQWDSGSRPTPIGGQVFAAGGYFGGMDEYNAAGAKGWFAELPQDYGWAPAADDRRVYTLLGGSLRGFDRATGAKTLDIPVSVGTRGGVTVTLGDQDDAIGYVGGFFPSIPGLASFDLGGGRVRWNQPGNFTGTAAVANGVIAIPEDGKLTFLDEATGARLGAWDSGAAGGVGGNVVLTDQYAFVNAFDGVHAIDLVARQSVWSTRLYGDLALANGVLVVSNPQGVTAFAVPEPTAGLGLTGAAAALLLRRRGRQRLG